MRTVIQRVSHASVSIGCHCKSAIQGGLLILLGIEEADNEEDIDWLCRKITGLRIFDDENGVMNRSILETGGDILVISQFTLMASYKKGNRPSYIRAARAYHSHPPLRKLLPEIGRSARQTRADGRIRSRNESGPVEPRPRHHLHGH